ncbi:MAG TPA: hypothetical protein VJU86_16385 [Pyrinomonadaceae bacterium]|nr:hypothetical protein [Pyrinomonadaceae bacterium]
MKHNYLRLRMVVLPLLLCGAYVQLNIGQIRNKGVDPEWANKLRDAPRQGLFSHGLPRQVFLCIYGDQYHGNLFGPAYNPQHGWMFRGQIARDTKKNWIYSYQLCGGGKSERALPQGMREKLAEVEPGGKLSNSSVSAFGPNNGWAFTHAKAKPGGIFYTEYTRSAYFDHVPDDFGWSLKSLVHNCFIDAISFTPEGGWLIVYRSTRGRYTQFFAYKNIPREMVNTLADLKKRDRSVISVALGPNGSWYVLAQMIVDNARSRRAPRTLDSIEFVEKNEGTLATILSREPLDDISTYRRGDVVFVVIPDADVPSSQSTPVSNSGFTDFKMDQKTEDLILSFRLNPGKTAHVSQNGRQVSILFRSGY